jgi:hypothetical protein
MHIKGHGLHVGWPFGAVRRRKARTGGISSVPAVIVPADYPAAGGWARDGVGGVVAAEGIVFYCPRTGALPLRSTWNADGLGVWIVGRLKDFAMLRGI